MIRGSIVALITPFKDNGDVDYRKLAVLINWHIVKVRMPYWCWGLPPRRLHSRRENRI